MAILAAGGLVLPPTLGLHATLERRVGALLVALLAAVVVGGPVGFGLYTIVGGTWQSTDTTATIISLVPGCLVFGVVASARLARQRRDLTGRAL